MVLEGLSNQRNITWREAHDSLRFEISSDWCIYFSNANENVGSHMPTYIDDDRDYLRKEHPLACGVTQE